MVFRHSIIWGKAVKAVVMSLPGLQGYHPDSYQPYTELLTPDHFISSPPWEWTKPSVMSVMRTVKELTGWTSVWSDRYIHRDVTCGTMTNNVMIAGFCDKMKMNNGTTWFENDSIWSFLRMMLNKTFILIVWGSVLPGQCTDFLTCFSVVFT